MKRLIALAILLASLSLSAKPATASCWFEGNLLFADGLPIGVAFSITAEFYPTGTTRYTADGTYSVPTWASDAYFWVRGHGPSLRKPGAQLNDYHLVAECHA
jgi:hypothetical protein